MMELLKKSKKKAKIGVEDGKSSTFWQLRCKVGFALSVEGYWAGSDLDTIVFCGIAGSLAARQWWCRVYPSG